MKGLKKDFEKMWKKANSFHIRKLENILILELTYEKSHAINKSMISSNQVNFPSFFLAKVIVNL